MLVSVVIPAFNAQEWLPETLGSVLKQTYKDLEIVVIDDGSSDGTAQVAEAVLRSGEVPYRITRQANMGVSAARNRGWRSARGQWVQFLDADDLLHPRKIELQMALSEAQGAADVIYSDWQKLVRKAATWQGEGQVRAPNIGKHALADILLDANFQQLGSQLFRVRVLEGIGGFDEAHDLVEDVELCIKIALADGVFVKARSSGPVFWYRDRPGSLSKSNQRQFVEACIRNAKLVERHVRTSGSGDAKTIDAIVDVYYGGTRYFADHDWNRFEEIVCDIEALRPGFVPKAPARLKMLSRIAGYRGAERLAVLYRRSKSLAGNLRRDRSSKAGGYLG